MYLLHELLQIGLSDDLENVFKMFLMFEVKTLLVITNMNTDVG